MTKLVNRTHGAGVTLGDGSSAAKTNIGSSSTANGGRFVAACWRRSSFDVTVRRISRVAGVAVAVPTVTAVCPRS